jgi:cobalt-zinc-cadmium efflux system protein
MHFHSGACSDDERRHARRGGGQDRAAHARRLAIVLAMILGYMVAEVIGGLLSGSLALLADAAHMFSDAAALTLSLFAVWIARRPPTPKMTYGYYRTEILAALVNGAALLAIAVFIFLEAYERIFAPPEVRGGLMMAVAAGGLAVNLAALAILAGGRAENLNIRGAWLHVLADTLGSVAAISAGVLILAFGWAWADPLASVAIGLLIIRSAWSLVKEAVAVLMESTPSHLDVDEIRDALIAVDGVREVHSLHIWTITSGLEALSAHVVVDEGRSYRDALTELRAALHDRFGVDHVTIQIEPENFAERAPPF